MSIYFCVYSVLDGEWNIPGSVLLSDSVGFVICFWKWTGFYNLIAKEIYMEVFYVAFYYQHYY